MPGVEFWLSPIIDEGKIGRQALRYTRIFQVHPASLISIPPLHACFEVYPSLPRRCCLALSQNETYLHINSR
jgi:hypothetical protein